MYRGDTSRRQRDRTSRAPARASGQAVHRGVSRRVTSRRPHAARVRMGACPDRSKVRWGRVLLLGALGVACSPSWRWSAPSTPAPRSPSRTPTRPPRRCASSTRTARRWAASARRTASRSTSTQVPEHVQRAVLAAEDRGFYTEPGISPRGIARALLTNVRGGGVQQGGSTITQQYAKNAFLTSERTYSRKVQGGLHRAEDVADAREGPDPRGLPQHHLLGPAGVRDRRRRPHLLRHRRRLDADRGAGRGARREHPLARPTTTRPRTPSGAQARWEYVLDGMVEQGWLTAAGARRRRSTRRSCAPGQGPRNNDLSGPKGHVIRQVQAELAARGFDEQRLSDGGLVVRTTIRKARAGRRGRRRAGRHGRGTRRGRPAGRAGLGRPGHRRGGGLLRRRDRHRLRLREQQRHGPPARLDLQAVRPRHRAVAGHEPAHPARRQRREGVPRASRGRSTNFGGDVLGTRRPRRGDAPVGEHRLLPARPRGRAGRGREDGARGGHPATTRRWPTPTARSRAGIALGSYEVQVLDQAVAYATFANGGVPVRPFFVREVRRGDEMLFQAEAEVGPAAFSEDVAADATWAMQEVVQRGTGAGRAARRRPRGRGQDRHQLRQQGRVVRRLHAAAVHRRLARLRRPAHHHGRRRRGHRRRAVEPHLEELHGRRPSPGQPELDLPEPVYGGTRARFDDGGRRRRRRRAPRPRRSRAPQTSAPRDDGAAAAEPEREPAPEPSAEPADGRCPSSEQEPAEAAGTEPAPGRPRRRRRRRRRARLSRPCRAARRRRAGAGHWRT